MSLPGHVIVAADLSCCILLTVWALSEVDVGADAAEVSIERGQRRVDLGEQPKSGTEVCCCNHVIECGVDPRGIGRIALAQTLRGLHSKRALGNEQHGQVTTGRGNIAENTGAGPATGVRAVVVVGTSQGKYSSEPAAPPRQTSHRSLRPPVESAGRYQDRHKSLSNSCRVRARPLPGRKRWAANQSAPCCSRH
jgi:hypothetical protein